jgi:hypothetical protein
LITRRRDVLAPVFVPIVPSSERSSRGRNLHPRQPVAHFPLMTHSILGWPAIDQALRSDPPFAAMPTSSFGNLGKIADERQLEQNDCGRLRIRNVSRNKRERNLRGADRKIDAIKGPSKILR